MAGTFTLAFDKGLVTSKGPEHNAPGELRVATGCYYKPGDAMRLHKLPGRVEYTGGSVRGKALGRVRGLTLATFDNDSEYLIAYVASGYYYANADPDSSPTWALLSGNLSNSATSLFASHYDDRWYMVSETNPNLVFELDPTDGVTPTTRPMGMSAPTALATSDVAAISSGTIYRAGSSAYYAPFWLNPEYFVDTDEGTYATAEFQTGSRVFEVSGFPAIDAGSELKIKQSSYQTSEALGDPFSEEGNLYLNVQIFVSTNGGLNWSGIYNRNSKTHNSVSYTIPAAVSSGDLHIALSGTVTGTLGDVYTAMRWFLWDVQGATGGDPAISGFNGSFYYGYYEYDEVRGIQGPAVWTPEAVTISGNGADGQNAVQITFPSGRANPNTTHFVPLRTSLSGTPMTDLGHLTPSDGSSYPRVAWSETSNPTFIDFFRDPGVDEIPTPSYDYLEVTLPDSTMLPFHLHVKPPRATFVTVYQNSVVLLPADQPRSIRYSEPGLPESFPLIYEISKFPLPDNDNLIALVPMNRVLLILAKGAAMYVNDLPLVSDNNYSEAEPRVLAGIPGCVGRNAATAISLTGEPGAAWVSRHGIEMTDGNTAARITDDLDWPNTVNQANLSSALLGWDESRQLLWFAYDYDGDGKNDRYLLGHFDDQHIKGTIYGRFPRPKWTGPHYGRFSAWAEGEVQEVYRVYTGHPVNDTVFLEWSGVFDPSFSAATEFDGISLSGIPFSIQTGKIFTEDYEEFSTFKFSLRHSDWGANETMDATMIYKRDHNSPTSGVLTKSVALDGERGTEFLFGRSCETLEVKLQHLDTGLGSVSDLRAVSRKTGKAGSR